MKQLSPQDASFVFRDSAAAPNHVGSVHIYDPGTSPLGELTETKIVNFFRDRLHVWPNARRRLVRVPFDSDYPYWVEDEDFELEYHIRRIALPKPADWRELYKVAARIFARPLDMTRPLWELFVIEGLDHLDGVPAGSFAVLTKTHQAAIDGSTGKQLVELLQEASAEPAAPEPTAPAWQPERVPSDAELLMRSGFNNLLQPLRFAQVMGESAGTLTRAVGEFGAIETVRPLRVPRTRFNGEITPHRVIGACRFPLDEMRRLRKAVKGARVNDTVLAVCGGALRKYLTALGELDEDSLVALAPLQLRARRHDRRMPISATFIPIGTNIEDPYRRLRAVRRFTVSSKAMNNAVGAQMMTDYNQFVPAFTAAMAGRLMSNVTGGARLPFRPTFNLTVTNVPGPQAPLYLMGAKLVSSISLGPIDQGMGLAMPATSYCGELTLGFVSCREMLPDPALFLRCIEEAYGELRDAAFARIGEPTTVVVPEPVPSSA